MLSWSSRFRLPSLEYTSEDEADEQRFKKMLDRVGKPVMMSAEAETSEIIRRRLFEWHGLPDDARATIRDYADWILDHRQQIPEWFPIDSGRETFAATYPFHPSASFGLRAEVAGIAAFPENARYSAAAGAVGVEGLPGRIQGRAPRPLNWPWHRPA